MFQDESVDHVNNAAKEQKNIYNAITDDSGYYNIIGGKKLEGEKYKII
jgi:hypothetical protein